MINAIPVACYLLVGILSERSVMILSLLQAAAFVNSFMNPLNLFKIISI
jgi:hypothetical protein